MKTYFNFQQEIQSKDVSQAIALPNGIGPFMGFGDGFIDDLGNTITLNPGNDSEVLPLEWLEVKDRITSRNIVTPDSSDNIKFGCISRDGTLFTSTESSIVLDISNNRGYKKEVMVFAYHLPVEEPVDNPVSFVAYWNTSDISFYDIFKKYHDVYYPAEEEGRAYDLEYMDPLGNHSISFDYLDNQLEIACEEYHNSKIYMVPIGIYGTGLNPYNNLTEPFSIIPYNSRFPMSINYNLAIHNAFKKSIVNMEKKFRDLLDYDTIKAYIDSKIEAVVSSFGEIDVVPSGTIVLWAGTEESIPKGWHKYNGANGRVVIGWQHGGIDFNGRSILQNVGDTTGWSEHSLNSSSGWSFTLDGSNTPLPEHSHDMSHYHMSYAVNEGYSHNWESGGANDRNCGTVNWGLGYTNPVNTSWAKGGTDGHDVVNTGGAQGGATSRSLTISKMVPSIVLMYIQKD